MSSHPCLSALSDSALLVQAGPSVFDRGQTYASSGAIRNPTIPPLEPDEAIALEAVVQGTKPYHTRVWVDVHDGLLSGDCDCPHADDGYFCKHQVAMALTLRGIMGGEAPKPDPAATKKVAAAAKRAETQAKNREALRQFLHQQSAEALAERLWLWAEDDRHRMAELKSWYTQSNSGHDPKALKSAISDILRSTKGFLDRRDSDLYAHQARQLIPMLAPWLQQDPAQLRELCEHALLRMFKVAEHSDDSNGEIGDVMIDLHDLLLDALRASPPPAAWLDRWFALQAADPWGLWSEEEVLAVAGPAVQTRYAERAAADWHQWLQTHPPQPEVPVPAKGRKPALSAWSASLDRIDWERRKLRRRYLDSLKQQGDVQGAIDVMRAHLAGAMEHIELVQFCEAHERYREAMQYVQAARQRYPEDGRVADALLRCYERDGWDDEALALRRQQFEACPDLAHFQALLKAARQAGQDEGRYKASLFDWARQQEQALAPGFTFVDRLFNPPGRASAQPDVSLRVSWLLADQQPEAALALACTPKHHCAPRLLLELARQLPPERNADAIPLLLRVFNGAIQNDKSPYHEPLALVRETLSRMTSVQRADWLLELRRVHKAKRNFLAGLPG